MKKISYYTLSALFVGSIALSMVSCADDDLGNSLSDGDKEAIVQFEITDAQEEALSKYNDQLVVPLLPDYPIRTLKVKN